MLAAKRKNLVRQGKGNCPNATRELTEAEEDALFENGQFGVQDPKSLQRALWWFLSLHFGWRARDESRKLCWGDVGLASDPDTDSEYLVWKSERGSITRTGQDAGHLVAMFIQILDLLDEMAITTATTRHYKVRNKEPRNYLYFTQMPGVL